MADNLITAASAASRQRTSARALRLGRRLKMAGLETADLGQGEAITTSPLVLRVGSRGFAALFPYGTAVLIGVSRTDEEMFLQKLSDHIESRLDTRSSTYRRSRSEQARIFRAISSGSGICRRHAS